MKAETQTTPEHAELIVHCIGIVVIEIQKISDSKRRMQVARNAAEALRSAVNAR